VLNEIEDLAQKASVLIDFADSKTLQLLPPTPSSFGPPTAGPASQGRDSSPFFAASAMRRTSSSPTSEPYDRRLATSQRAEVVAAEALFLYIKVLAFLQKGITKARELWSNRESTARKQTASPDFNDGSSLFIFSVCSIGLTVFGYSGPVAAIAL
jgi:serine/threonine-protein kinase ULK/ATG1